MTAWNRGAERLYGRAAAEYIEFSPTKQLRETHEVVGRNMEGRD